MLDETVGVVRGRWMKVALRSWHSLGRPTFSSDFFRLMASPTANDDDSGSFIWPLMFVCIVPFAISTWLK